MTGMPPAAFRSLQKVFDDIDKAKAELCRRDFFYFVQEFWEVIIDEDPIWNWHIPYLCKELQQLAFDMIARKTKKYDLVINIPPGTTKSTIVTVMFPAWCWIARHPTRWGRDGRRLAGAFLRFITGSYAEALSLEHADYSRDIIKSDKFQLYFPEISIRQDKDRKSNYKIEILDKPDTQGGNRFSTSTGGSGTGVHAHFIIIDDPVNPNQALSDTKRKTANDWMDHTLSTRKVDKRTSVSILIMQRLHKTDCTGHIVSKKGKKIKHIILPGTDEYTIQPAELKENYEDGLLDPVRLDRKVLKDLRVDLGSYGYGGQIGQDPKPREGGTFQEGWFEVVNAAPAGGTKWVRGWDLAATGEEEGGAPAFTASARMKYVDGFFYIDHAEHFRASPGGTRRRMRNRASQDGPDTIIDFPQDPGQAGKSQVRDLVVHLAEYEARYSPESGSKELRAEPLSAQCEAGNVKIVDPDRSWSPEYLSEICYFPNGFKDWVDATVRAYNRVVKLKNAGEEDVSAPEGISNPHQIDPDGAPSSEDSGML